MNSVDQVAKNLLELLPFIHEKFLRPQEHMYRGKLSKVQFMIVSILKRKGAVQMSALAAIAQVSKQQLTPLIDKLMEQKIVRRKTNLEDRRAVQIELTEEGDELIQSIRSENRQALIEKLKILPEAELQELEKSLDCIRSILEKIE